MINTELLLIAFVGQLMKTVVLSVLFLYFYILIVPPPIVLLSHIGDWCSNLQDFPLISGPSLNVQGDIKKFGSVKLW